MKFNRNMNAAPKDRKLLLDIDCFYPVIGSWCNIEKRWVYAGDLIEIYSHDGHFIEECFKRESDRTPIGWAFLPEIEYEME